MQRKESNVEACEFKRLLWYLIWKLNDIFHSDFEQEAGYPKQDFRFLDLSVRGLCVDERGKVHTIDKQLMIGMKKNKNKIQINS